MSNVLLLEDNADTRTMLVYLLEAAGHSVRAVGSIKLALQELQLASYEVLISDISLPDGDGWDLMRELRRRDASICGIAMSGYSGAGDVAKSLESGFQHHLVKPIDFDELESILRTDTLP